MKSLHSSSRHAHLDLAHTCHMIHRSQHRQHWHPSSAQLLSSKSKVLPGRKMMLCSKATGASITAAPAEAPARTSYYKELLEVALQAAAKGAEVVAAGAEKPRNIEFKGATDLVTDTDKASEAAVLEVINRAFPDHAILGEEGGVSGNMASPFLWCLDPLDGTTNFAHGYPSFAVSVGVLEEGTPVAGVVVEFAGGAGTWVQRTYAATKGGGATLNGKPIKCSVEGNINRALLTTGFGYEHGKVWAANLELFKHFTDVTRGVRRLGAAAVDLCHVAIGAIDGYWEYSLKPWDMAAGALIAKEAGAVLTTCDGQPFTVFSRSILASNPAIHSSILEQTQPKTEGLQGEGEELAAPWYVPEGYDVSKLA